MNRFSLIVLSILFLVTQVKGQDTLFQQLVDENTMELKFETGEFKGNGWEFILEKASESQNILIGEEHFTNEIPVFISSLLDAFQFDNFYIEVDPVTTELMVDSLANLKGSELTEFMKRYGDVLSFYSIEPELELLKKVIAKGINILGSDQIVMYSDRMICDVLSKQTKNEKAKHLYLQISNQSEQHLTEFLENPQSPMFMMTEKFDLLIDSLLGMEISEDERITLENMKVSKEIYLKMDHSRRVSLILHHLIEDFDRWNKKRNLFKYGANHMLRGESFLDVYDIGNVVANVTKSDFQNSLHIMILGSGGFQGSPFRTFPPSPLNPNSMYLKSIQPFMKTVDPNSWIVVDLLPLRTKLFREEWSTDLVSLERLIKGFDILIIIPEVTAAKFPEIQD